MNVGDLVEVFTLAGDPWFEGVVEAVCTDGMLVIFDEGDNKRIQINPQQNMVCKL